MLRQENENKLRDGLANIVSHHETRAKEFIDTLFSSIESRVSENATSRVLELMFEQESPEGEASGLAKDSRDFHRALSTLMTTGARGHAPSTTVEKEIFAFQVKSSFQKTLVAPLLASVKRMIRSEFFDVFLRDLNETTIGRLLPDLMEKILNAEAIAMSDRNADRTAFLYEAERNNVKAAYRAGYYEGRAAASSEGAQTRNTSSRAEGLGNDEIGRTVGSLELGALAVNFLDPLPLPSSAATPHGQTPGSQPSQAHDETTPTIVVSNKGVASSRVSSFRRPSTASVSTVASGAHLGTHSVLGAAASILGQVSRLQSFRRAVISASSSPLGGASMHGNGGGSGVVGSYDVPAAIRREEALWRSNDALHSLLKRRCEEETQRVEQTIEHTTAKLKARVKVLEDEAATAKTASAEAKASLLQVEDLNAMLIDQLASGRAHEGRLAAEAAFYQRELASVGGYRRHTSMVDDAVRTLELPSEEAHAATQRSLGAAKGAMLTHENRDRFNKARSLLHFGLPSRVSMEQQEAILRQASAVRDVEDENASLREKIRRLEEELYSSRRKVLAETASLRANERKRIEQLNTQFVLAKKRLMAAEGVIQTLRAERTLAGSRGSGGQPSDMMTTAAGARKTREISEGAFVEDTLRAQLALREKEIEILRQQLLVSEELRTRIGDMDAQTPKVRGGHEEGVEKDATGDSPFTAAPEDSFLHVGPLFGVGLENADSDEERTIDDSLTHGGNCDVGRENKLLDASRNNTCSCDKGVEAAKEHNELKKVEGKPMQQVLSAQSSVGSREGLGAVAKWIQLDLARKSFRRLSRVVPTTTDEGGNDTEESVDLLAKEERVKAPSTSSVRPSSGSDEHRGANSFRRLGDELLKVSSSCHSTQLEENPSHVFSTETKSNVEAHVAAADTTFPANALKTPSRNRPSTAYRGSRHQGSSVTSVGGGFEKTSLRVMGTSAAGAQGNSPTRHPIAVPCPPRRESSEAHPPNDGPSPSPRNASSLSSRPPTRHASPRVETNNRVTLVDALLLEGRGRSRQLQAAIQSTANAGRRPLSASARSGQFL